MRVAKAAAATKTLRASRARGGAGRSKSRRVERGFFFAAALTLLQPAASAAGGDLRREAAAPPGSIDCGSVPLPPARFDHPSAHRVLVMHLPFGMIDNACRARGILAPTAFIGANGTVALLDAVAGAGYEIQACSWKSGDDRYVLLPRVGTGGVTKDFEACALRHEIGHLNGWPASHPDAHFGFLDQGSANAMDAALAIFPPLRPVRLMRFPHTPEGIAFRRREMKTRDRVTVTVTEAMVIARP